MAKKRRLIDANAFKSFLCECCNILHSDEPCEPSDCNVLAVIDEQPTVDAVEVVRCEECQSWDTKHCSDGQGWCPKVCGYRHGGWFCAAGKRKTITDQTMKALEAMDKNAHGGADDGKEE